ncbi:MAG TPA: hypothetical protein VER04_17685 [Polyangiaceae bacterium]|nr:hypothetical protein [Polyangiaceae bacterium]
MQQTKSYWRLVALTGIVSAFIASACVVTTSTDDDTNNAGAGGAGTAGAATAGAHSAGANTAGANTAGSSAAGMAGSAQGGAGPVSFQCDPGEGGAQGTPNSCEPVDANDVCQKCTQQKCCAEYSACYATDPGNQCGWGGPAKVDGADNEGGELYCMLVCLQKAAQDSGTEPDDSQVQTCANNCATTVSNGATKECGSVIGVQTSDTVACLRDNCSTECIVGTPAP